jgi:hypothetical protein
VREYDRLDVARNVRERRQVGLERFAVSRQSGIDRGETPTVLHEVPVDQRSAEPVDLRNDVACRLDARDRMR